MNWRNRDESETKRPSVFWNSATPCRKSGKRRRKPDLSLKLTSLISRIYALTKIVFLIGASLCLGTMAALDLPGCNLKFSPAGSREVVLFLSVVFLILLGVRSGMDRGRKGLPGELRRTEPSDRALDSGFCRGELSVRRSQHPLSDSFRRMRNFSVCTFCCSGKTPFRR